MSRKAASSEIPPRQTSSRPPLERMMRIHDAIQSGKYPNAAALAEQLEVSSKSVQRDIEFMRERMNFPI